MTPKMWIAMLLLALLGANCEAQQLIADPAKPAQVTASLSPKEEDAILAKAEQDYIKANYGVALEEVNQVIKGDSQKPRAFLQRALIYAKQKEWEKADYDYQVVLSIDPTNVAAKFSLAELNFMQKKYDDARAGFVAFKKDPDLGDFATYKVFLCDLLGAHEDVASKELQALDDVGGNPSYYFGNAAWDLVHNKPDDAKGWLGSASRIYANAPKKYSDYTASLVSLGYLPLPASSRE